RVADAVVAAHGKRGAILGDAAAADACRAGVVDGAEVVLVGAGLPVVAGDGLAHAVLWIAGRDVALVGNRREEAILRDTVAAAEGVAGRAHEAEIAGLAGGTRGHVLRGTSLCSLLADHLLALRRRHPAVVLAAAHADALPVASVVDGGEL